MAFFLLMATVWRSVWNETHAGTTIRAGRVGNNVKRQKQEKSLSANDDERDGGHGREKKNLSKL